MTELVDRKNYHMIINDHTELTRLKKGRRAICKQHYQLRPHNLVMIDRKLYCVKGVHNRGTRVMLIANLKNIAKAINKVNVKYHVNGILVTIK